MSQLRIFNESSDTEEFSSNKPEEIMATLRRHGIDLEHWAAEKPLAPSASQEEILDAYSISLNRLMGRGRFKSADVVSIHPATANHGAMRQKFFAEHTHSDNEIRFFVDGAGLFYIKSGGKIFGVLCEKGDLLNVPAGISHWYDMGSLPFFKCIRIFTDEAGWIGNFSGSGIEKRFPDMDHFRI